MMRQSEEEKWSILYSEVGWLLKKDVAQQALV
jgi:hypothetical protein